ncbi:MAG: OAM dimerization domain-containing protein [Halarsenatibacteraceae bacterium]
MSKDLTAVKPYGDTMNDGKVQLSFTLPVPTGPEGKEAARKMASQLNLKEVEVVHTKDLGEDFSFYVVYGQTDNTIDYTKIRVARATTSVMDYYEINQYIEENIGRPLRVVGACTGSDAHTVGLDAIMNMKGYSGEYGLERYPMFKTLNLGSQVPNEELIHRALEFEADAILVSQVVTQKDIHVKNLTELVELLEAERLRDRFTIVVGGPRISHELALELGFDAGFGIGTLPPEVASFLAEEFNREINKEEK